MFERLRLPTQPCLRLYVLDFLMHLAPDVALHRAYFLEKSSPQDRMFSYLFLFCLREANRQRIAIQLYDQNCLSGLFHASGHSMAPERRGIWKYV
jgi:hypothetical protein